MDKNIRIKRSTIIWIILILIFLVWVFWPSENSIEDSTGDRRVLNNFTLYFYDENTNCSLNGKIYSGEQLLGEVYNGEIELSDDDYQKINPEELFYISGETDSCFEENSGLPFYRSWTFVDWEYLFETGEPEFFYLDLNPRRPVFLEEMQGFIRPYETKDYLESKIRTYLQGDDKENLDRINEYSIRYRSDFLLFNKIEYWQTPAETLEKGHGDCEDWAVTTLSLIREYNSSIECYNALWYTHLSIMCFLENSFIIYDQGNIKREASLNFYGLTDLEKKARIRGVRNNYLDSYGIKTGETRLDALFNEAQLITFEEPEDFIEWVIRR